MLCGRRGFLIFGGRIILRPSSRVRTLSSSTGGPRVNSTDYRRWWTIWSVDMLRDCNGGRASPHRTCKRPPDRYRLSTAGYRDPHIPSPYHRKGRTPLHTALESRTRHLRRGGLGVSPRVTGTRGPAPFVSNAVWPAGVPHLRWSNYSSAMGFNERRMDSDRAAAAAKEATARRALGPQIIEVAGGECDCSKCGPSRAGHASVVHSGAAIGGDYRIEACTAGGGHRNASRITPTTGLTRAYR